MFLTLNEAKELIEKGKLLHIAGDEGLLSLLPRGNWIGGTTPYFITNQGGILTKDKLFVTELSDAKDFKFCEYDEMQITEIADHTFSDGFSFLIMPFASNVASVYSKKAPYIDNLLMVPIVGWISGFDLSTGGTAKVYNGSNGNIFTDKAVALHINLPKERLASIGIVNIFEEAEASDVIEFNEDLLEVKDCLVNGSKMNFTEYITTNKIDTKMPLVANYNGVYINVSIKEIKLNEKVVSLYAPVFKGEKYHFAKNVNDYEKAFRTQLKDLSQVTPIFSCNCILNYLYGNFEGKTTPPFEGPVTFGEVAYQLLNQTLVYLEY